MSQLNHKDLCAFCAGSIFFLCLFIEDSLFQVGGVPALKVDEYDVAHHYPANPDLLKRINALLDHSLDIGTSQALQGQDRKHGKWVHNYVLVSSVCVCVCVFVHP